MKKLGLALCLVFACKSSSSTTSQPSPQGPPLTEPAAAEPPPPEPTPSPSQAPDTQPAPTTPTTPATPAQTPTTPPKLKPMIGPNCGEGDTCADGLECVKYYGIAGARGPQFKTCEQTCSAKKACPTGSKCVTIADGPGQVCRS